MPANKQGKPHICQFCGEEVIALPSTTRKCPSCGETIKIAATICKKCHKPVPPIIPRNTTPRNTVVVNEEAKIGKQTDVEQPKPTPRGDFENPPKKKTKTSLLTWIIALIVGLVAIGSFLRGFMEAWTAK
ncbi:MAG: hypothetical protein J5878_00785 [Oscillospiraceae bacterium]|nr:hypothetical protein [Oscillospiraceae bacterium]